MLFSTPGATIRSIKKGTPKGGPFLFSVSLCPLALTPLKPSANPAAPLYRHTSTDPPL